MAAAIPPGDDDNINSSSTSSENEDVEIATTELQLPEAEDGSDQDQDSTSTNTNATVESDCSICLQPCVHPLQLPCSHIFCYLCIKGVALQGPNSCCAICRATIPRSVLTNPNPLLKDVGQLLKESHVEGGGYQWYYESRSGGWWQYDSGTISELEKVYNSNQPSCQLLLAGLIYVIDFRKMIQYQKHNKSVSRRIRRGVNLKKRGVAGLFTAENENADDGDDDDEGGSNNGRTSSFPASSTSTSRSSRTRRRARRNNPPPPTDEDDED